MTNYIITYQDALEICQNYHNENFYKKEIIIDGYKVVSFNYFICDYNDFNQPLKYKPYIHAFDMRGVTFIFDKDDNFPVSRFLMLPKFFNLNQNESSLFENVKNKKIKNVTSKEDGSLIAFMKLPNNKIFAKTQDGFTNEMSINSMKLFNEDLNLNRFITSYIDKGFTPLFEYVSFDNRIVLNYQKTQLILIGLRSNIDGSFISASEIKTDLHKVKTYNLSLNQLIEEAKTAINKEGWVIQFTDNQFIKIKTEWYFKLHALRTTNIFREDYIIETFLHNKIDDLICQLDINYDSDAIRFINYVCDATKRWMSYIDENVLKLYNRYLLYDDVKHFAIDNNKEAFFGLSLNFIQDKEIYKQNKLKYMMKMSYRLNDAKQIIKKFSI